MPISKLTSRCFAAWVTALLMIFIIGIFAAEPLYSQEPTASCDLTQVLEKYRDRGMAKWAGKIEELVRRGDSEAVPEDALLFFGSSSFRLWENMATDMEPYLTANRGYGGAKYVDMVLFADQILRQHSYRALMLFAANDARDQPDDSTPEEITIVVREIIRISQDHQPDAPVFIVEITPTISRWSAWNKNRQLNAALREIALTTPNVRFIPTAEHFLRADGTVDESVFVDDKLHLNKAGYQRWAKLIKTSLDEFLP